MKSCSINGCTRACGRGRTLCPAHLWRRHAGKPLDTPVRAKAAPGTYTHCTFAGCQRKNRAKGLCAMHLQAAWRASPDLPLCTESGCARRASGARGLCMVHYKAQLATERGELCAECGKGRACRRDADGDWLCVTCARDLATPAPRRAA